MSTFLIISFPMLAVGLVLFRLAYKKRDKNFMIPGYVMVIAGIVNFAIGLGLSHGYS